MHTKILECAFFFVPLHPNCEIVHRKSLNRQIYIMLGIIINPKSGKSYFRAQRRGLFL